MKPVSEVKLMDCMDYMRGFPDKFFELAVVDPPYGIGIGTEINRAGFKEGSSKNSLSRFEGQMLSKNWDSSPPSADYFKELFRVSKVQIIWGGNYFLNNLESTRCLIVWDKMTYVPTMSQIEIAWTSIATHSRLIKINSNDNGRQHPTQKPIALYEWLLKNYAKPGDKILDTHLGSQSSRIAAYKLGFDFYGTEIDADYFNEGCARFEKSIAMPIFDSIEIPEQLKMF